MDPLIGYLDSFSDSLFLYVLKSTSENNLICDDHVAHIHLYLSIATIDILFGVHDHWLTLHRGYYNIRDI